jgi:hypothetical protein
LLFVFSGGVTMAIFVFLAFIALSTLSLLAIDRNKPKHQDAEEFFEDDEYFIGRR